MNSVVNVTLSPKVLSASHASWRAGGAPESSEFSLQKPLTLLSPTLMHAAPTLASAAHTPAISRESAAERSVSKNLKPTPELTPSATGAMTAELSRRFNLSLGPNGLGAMLNVSAITTTKEEAGQIARSVIADKDITSATSIVIADRTDDTAVNEAPLALGDGQSQRATEAEQLALQAELTQLSQRDIEVRAHEQAHASVGGNLAGPPSFTYEQGSDGQRYAVAGEVAIDVSVVAGDPQATLSKMKQVYAAAMAPVAPSMADIRIASEALRKMNEANQELAIERQQAVLSRGVETSLAGTQSASDLTQLSSAASHDDAATPGIEEIGAVHQAQYLDTDKQQAFGSGSFSALLQSQYQPSQGMAPSQLIGQQIDIEV